MAEPSAEPSVKELIERIQKLEMDNADLRSLILHVKEGLHTHIMHSTEQMMTIGDALWPLVETVFPKFNKTQNQIEAIVRPCSVDPRVNAMLDQREPQLIDPNASIQSWRKTESFFNTAHVDSRYRSRFNPFEVLDPASEKTIEDVTRLANAIIVVRNERDEAARAMVRGLILHVMTAPEFNDKDRNLITVRSLIVRGHWQLEKTMREMDVYENNPPHELLWQAMERNAAFDGLIAGIGSRFRSMMLTAAKTFEAVLQLTELNTEFLDSPGMQRILGL